MINTKYIEDRLKEYKEKESIIETTLARVEVYKNDIDNPDVFTHINLMPSLDIGMPKGKGGKPSSPVETIINNNEENREDIVETLKQWIREDLSRIYPLQIEKEQIDGALNALTTQQRCIIECKYFDDMIWRDVEINFNNKFNTNYLTFETLKKMNKVSLEKLTRILKPYYNRFIV